LVENRDILMPHALDAPLGRSSRNTAIPFGRPMEILEWWRYPTAKKTLRIDLCITV